VLTDSCYRVLTEVQRDRELPKAKNMEHAKRRLVPGLVSFVAGPIARPVASPARAP